ncbi:MAG: ornithine carbamoyltransferase [Planctomycetota bacterium]
MRHILSLMDLSKQEILTILELSSDLKSQLRSGTRPPIFERQVMGLLFEKPSLRTRVSFETLANQLGGSSLFLGQDVGWGKREPLCDFMPILTGYLDILVIRAKSHEKVVEATRYSQCPIINGLTDVSHPCQALADILTVKEIHGGLDDVKITYVGDANNVAYSLAIACAKLGITLSIAAPNGYQFEDSFLQELNTIAGTDRISQTDEIQQAVQDANFVYTDVWTSMGQEEESKQRLKDFAEFQVNSKLMNSAAENAKFLHCLPARRGEEVSSEVIDSPTSAIVAQAHNRLHAQKGLVAWLLNESES